METRTCQVPRIIPDSILSILCILEEDKGRFLWKLSRNQAGLSLVINAHPVDAHRVQRNHRPKSKGQTFSGKVLEKKTDASTKPLPVKKQCKKKCPSAIARDKARQQDYWQRKKRDSRKAKEDSTELIPAVSDLNVNSLNTIHIEAENSICEHEHETSVKSTLENLNSSNPPSLGIIELGDITPHNIKQLKRLNQVVFPVTYNDKFYKDVLEVGELARLAYFNDIVVGAVCCRVDNSDNQRRLYIMTLGALAPYRRLGLGTRMLAHVLKICEDDGNYDNVFLHVQVNNEGAIKFYEQHGFEIVEEKKNYYKRIEPADAYVLQKTFRSKEKTEAKIDGKQS